MSGIAEVRRKPVKITLSDGVARELKYDLNALASLEEVYGSVEAAFSALEKNSFKAVRCVLWAGLLHENEDLTIREVGSMFTARDIENLAVSLNEALTNDLPENKDDIPNV